MSLEPLLGSLTDTDTVTDIRTDNGDHDKFAHYAPKNEVTEAMINGTPIMALCGKVWVPSRNPDNFQVCPMCKDIYEELFGDD